MKLIYDYFLIKLYYGDYISIPAKLTSLARTSLLPDVLIMDNWNVSPCVAKPVIDRLTDLGCVEAESKVVKE